MDFIDGLNDLAVAAYEGASKVGAVVKKGAYIAGREVSYIAHDLYSIDGLEKWTKAFISELRFLSRFDAISNLFAECLKTIEAQRDIYYATLFLGSMRDCIKRIDTKHADGRITTQYQLQFPRRDDNPDKYDYAKFLSGIGNFCELGKFFQKQKIANFQFFTNLANQYGAVKVHGHRLEDLPVVCTLFDKPKDFFVFIASGINATGEFCKILQFFQVNKKWTFHLAVIWKNFDAVILCKFVGNIGKMGLIGFGPYYSHKMWFGVMDLAAQHASLLAYLIKMHKGRQNRFEHPQAAAAA